MRGDGWGHSHGATYTIFSDLDGKLLIETVDRDKERYPLCYVVQALSLKQAYFFIYNGLEVGDSASCPYLGIAAYEDNKHAAVYY